jgi:hypothetical protein
LDVSHFPKSIKCANAQKIGTILFWNVRKRWNIKRGWQNNLVVTLNGLIRNINERNTLWYFSGRTVLM